MRILFLTSKIDFERAGGSIPDLDCKVRDLAELGATTAVITLFSDLNRLPSLPYKVYEERVPFKTLPAIHRRVFEVLRKYESQTDVYHVEGQFALGAALYRLLGGKPIVAFYNREMVAWTKEKRLRNILRRAVERVLYRLLVGRIDRFVFTTPPLAERYRRYGLRVPDSRILIQTDYLDGKKILATLGVTSVPERGVNQHGPVRFLASGRMIKDKGFALLVEALTLLPQGVQSNIRVTLSGDGPEREALMRQVRDAGLADIVSFPGWTPKEKFYETLVASDVLVYPKFHIEVASVILLEGMFCRLATIIPRGGGLEWLAGAAAETFVDGDSTSLAKAIETLAESAQTRELRSRAAKARMKEFAHEKMAPALLALCKSAADLYSSHQP